jgi:protein involved in polysaccharide export with SLBB domain
MTTRKMFPSLDRLLPLATGLALALLVAGCGESPMQLTPGTPSGPAGGAGDAAGKAPAADGAAHPVLEYKLGPGDQVQVAVFGQADLSGKFEVDGNGNLVLPLVGTVPAEGRTVNELQQQITVELNKNFLVNPKVNVQVLNYRPYYILGEVNKPGSYPYVVSLTVRQAVAVAGGYTRRARSSPVRVIHAGKNAADAEEITPDDAVLPGDTIEVERRLF